MVFSFPQRSMLLISTLLLALTACSSKEDHSVIPPIPKEPSFQSSKETIAPGTPATTAPAVGRIAGDARNDLDKAKQVTQTVQQGADLQKQQIDAQLSGSEAPSQP